MGRIGGGRVRRSRSPYTGLHEVWCNAVGAHLKHLGLRPVERSTQQGRCWDTPVGGISVVVSRPQWDFYSRSWVRRDGAKKTVRYATRNWHWRIKEAMVRAATYAVLIGLGSTGRIEKVWLVPTRDIAPGSYVARACSATRRLTSFLNAYEQPDLYSALALAASREHPQRPNRTRSGRRGT